ncbi:MAG: hypothetical protein MI924_34605, partial [Chloroflexales bacterium]|nr:hypothetical protein [Chloroflexales bacterium]
DDAIVYQPEWITNAFFQSLATDEINEDNLRHAFEWLLLQALPDGGALQYNYPYATSFDGIAYLGAHLLDDPRLVWLAGRAVESRAQSVGFSHVQPGVENAVNRVGHSPTIGSCLLYGNSGLPTQFGPLAPDKIVFRDGWSSDSTYLLLNLRFTGWHRYKATNTLSLAYHKGPLIGEQLAGRSFAWLPQGRSFFRDKRIPRENLNGLLVERTGLSAVLSMLTGVGGRWAQDPPFYARVERFETNEQLDISSTLIENWHGWQQRRMVYFYHQGPIVIVDTAAGPMNHQAAMAWHGATVGELQNQRFQLRAGPNPAELVLLPVTPGTLYLDGHVATERMTGQQIVFMPDASGQLHLVSLILTGEWVNAQARLGTDTGAPVLQIERDGAAISLALSLGTGT